MSEETLWFRPKDSSPFATNTTPPDPPGCQRTEVSPAGSGRLSLGEHSQSNRDDDPFTPQAQVTGGSRHLPGPGPGLPGAPNFLERDHVTSLLRGGSRGSRRDGRDVPGLCRVGPHAGVPAVVTPTGPDQPYVSGPEVGLDPVLDVKLF